MKTGIVIAMEREGSSLKNKLGEPKEKKLICGMTFSVYDTKGGEVIIGESAPGTAEAASCTTILIDRYQVDQVINFGYVGSLKLKYGLFDIVAVDSVVQHDYDLTVFDISKGSHSCLGYPYIQADKKLTSSLADGYDLVRIACGNSFVSDEMSKTKIAEEFDADICDMESAGIALVCARAEVPFAMLKVVSDGLEGDSIESFKKHSKDIEGCTTLILDFINNKC